MPVLSVTTDANLNLSMPVAFSGVMWSSRPVKVVITLTAGATIASMNQTAGLPLIFNFAEDTPGSGIWTSFADTTNGTTFSPGINTQCFDVESSDDPGNPFPFCFDIEAFPNPSKDVVITVNGAPQLQAYSSATTGFGSNEIVATALISLVAGDIIRLQNQSDTAHMAGDLVLGGTNNVQLVIERVS